MRRAAVARSTFAAGAAPGIKAQWLSSTKRKKLGTPFLIDVPEPAMAEAFAVGGAINHVEIDAVVTFEADPPADARFLKVDFAGVARILSRDDLAEVSSSSAGEPQLFPPAGGTFVFPVFAERFTDSGKFFGLVKQLYEFIVTIPPFDRDDVKQAFALRGHFWESHPHRGRFQTVDMDFDCVRDKGTTKAWAVRNDLAVPALRTLLLDGKYGLVLIDSDVRGGAGGIADSSCPAWSSRANCPGESWFAVALHEIGHSLGLADEYLQASLRNRPFHNEKNVARNDDLTQTGWKERFTERPATVNSIYSIDEQAVLGRPGQRPVPKRDFVGLFQGCHYREDCFRPSLTCLMLRTDHKHFCPVCAAAIVSKLTGTA